MEQPSDAFEKKEPSAKSRDELIRLLLKLNAKLREKLNLAARKKTAPRQTDVVIIIMSSRENAGPGARQSKAAPSRKDWLENLFAEIEGGARKQKRP